MLTHWQHLPDEITQKIFAHPDDSLLDAASCPLAHRPVLLPVIHSSSVIRSLSVILTEGKNLAFRWHGQHGHDAGAWDRGSRAGLSSPHPGTLPEGEREEEGERDTTHSRSVRLGWQW